ncbi:MULTISPECIES: cytochrome o ubiquinol oxidase subunit IV [unclassified Bordetella]|uniref:cytochrome o ubiquinol oxidase subunit IV n=1 Tax=unclassified Bordetella TaxID=2630031 RepID=UPI0013227753|nr:MULTISPECIES: cytochrome o ubiquinol oxidase subunit IV [unclassified Bordetella]MVW72857.1 cytochrome o ubiquinol oxidase subunit IV [Bordetella sp. 15P40C-2]MVW80094.1 cytochrome o ubiquinol oxidase subunit IV [Bordetella sp. 02P26C-1]
MSHHTTSIAGHGHDHDHDHANHGSVKSYIVGFILSLILTLGSFGLLMVEGVPRQWIVPGIMILCVAQLFVQLVFFLHMGTSKSQRDNLQSFIFALFVIAIIVLGSLWVLHNMNANMMPGM